RAVACCNQSIRFKGWLEACQFFQAGIGADTLVLVKNTRSAILILDLNRYNLAAEAPFSRGPCRTAVALQAELIQFGPAQFPFLGHEIGANTLVNQSIIIATQHTTAKGGSGTL